MKVRMSMTPRPEAFSRLAGSRGSGSVETSKPGPSSRTVNSAWSRGRRAERGTGRGAARVFLEVGGVAVVGERGDVEAGALIADGKLGVVAGQTGREVDAAVHVG